MKQVAIVGIGLIGGSIGACLRQQKLCENVVGVGRNANKLLAAKDAGLIDTIETDLKSASAAADMVVICTPVETIADFAVDAIRASGVDCVVTDGGSTKLTILEDLRRLLGNEPKLHARFVGSHPIAGSEKSGFSAARADLFDRRMVVITPDEVTCSKAIARTRSFWESLGSEVTELSAAEHDSAMASISHLPHLVASALAAATPDKHMPLAAVGWGDTTRIASGDIELWRQIFSQNRGPLLDSIKAFQDTFSQIESAIANGDDQTLVSILQQGKDKRDSLGN